MPVILYCLSASIFNPLYVGIAAGIITSASMIPQLVKILSEKKADAVSIPMLLILICGVGLWVAYGVMKKDWPIIITNSFSVLVNIAVCVAGIFYKKPKNKRG